MDKGYIGWILDTIQIMVPDDYRQDMVVTEDEWGTAVSATRMLLYIGIKDVEQLREGLLLIDRLRGWLVGFLQAGALNRRERTEAGTCLANLGDPRFLCEAWNLPNKPTLGFVEIPAGLFTMGEEQEAHEVTLPRFYIACYPTTKDQFRSFIENSGFSVGNTDGLEGAGNHPMTWVCWQEAIAYCEWLTACLRERASKIERQEDLPRTEREFWGGLKDGSLRITLPSEAQWEKAARGVEGRRYPWGRERPDLERANYGACFGEPALGATSPAGCFPRGTTPEGIHDLAGNVWEYTRTLFGKDPFNRKEGWIRSYVPRWWTRSLGEQSWLGSEFPLPPYNADDGRENLDAGSEWDRAARGGSWTVDARRLRTTFRDALPPTSRHSADGFRVVVCELSD